MFGIIYISLWTPAFLYTIYHVWKNQQENSTTPDLENLEPEESKSGFASCEFEFQRPGTFPWMIYMYCMFNFSQEKFIID